MVVYVFHQVSTRLKTRVQDLGNSCIQLVENAGVVQLNPTDAYSKRDLAENARVVSEKVNTSLLPSSTDVSYAIFSGRKPFGIMQSCPMIQH